MSDITSTTSEEPAMEGGTLPRWVTVLFVAAFALVGYLLYATYAQRQALAKNQQDADKKTQALAAEVDKTNARVADLKGQLEVTSQKLGLTEDELARARSLAQQVRSQQEKSDAQLKQQIGEVQADTSTKFGQVATQINGTQTDLSATKADLDEVEELKRLGERDIFEFSLSKSSKGPEHVGPIQVQLRKVDTKHYRYTMNVIADDKAIEKKDKTVGEPVQFYVRGARAPYEIVVFDLGKDQAKGYLSAPKTAGAAPPSSSTPPGN